MFSASKKLLRPKPLPENGTIAITAPASPPDQLKLERGIIYLEKLGYRVEVGKSCHSATDYLAGTDALRSNEFMDFIDNPNIDAIFCARGGFGSMRMLKMLDFELIAEKRKLLVGFSDITALEWAIYAQTGLISVSGGMVATDMGNEEINPEFEASFWNLVKDGELDISITHKQEKPSEICGIGFPGTVSLITKLLGSPYFPNLDNALFLLEDVNEMRHKVEAYLQQLVICGAFDKASAIVLGVFSPAPTEEYPVVPEMESLLERVFRGVRMPLINGLEYGHIPQKKALPLGLPLCLSLGPQSTLKSSANLFGR